jgi:hypothetical protein
MRGVALFVSVYLVIMLSVGGVLTPATAEARERNTAAHMGLGVLAFVCTIPYGAAKTLYAAGGALTGGLALVLTGGRADIARAIIQPAVRGDYVVNPENLTLEEPLTFSGRAPETSSSQY